MICEWLTPNSRKVNHLIEVNRRQRDVDRVIHEEGPVFLEVIASEIVAKGSHEHVFFYLSSSIMQYVNGQALHFKSKIALVVIKMVNGPFEDAVRFNMFERVIRGKKTRKLIVGITCYLSVRNLSSSRLASMRTALGAAPVLSTGTC
jgi:hypothetical protein